MPNIGVDSVKRKKGNSFELIDTFKAVFAFFASIFNQTDPFLGKLTSKWAVVPRLYVYLRTCFSYL